jgi:hypothetical protein
MILGCAQDRPGLGVAVYGIGGMIVPLAALAYWLRRTAA